MVKRVPETERFGRQNADRERQHKEVRDALRIDGSQFVRLYEKMQELISNLGTTVANLVGQLTYTRGEVDSKVANPGNISPGNVSATGTVSANGSVTAGGNVTATGNVVANGQLRSPDVASFNITGNRLTVWVETATGRLGNTASSRRYKTNERPPNIDPMAVLEVAPRMFNYTAEIRKRDDPDYEGYVGPDYVVADEIGLMAEDLHDAGLTHLVYYEEVDGEMVPAAVDYVMWSVTLHVAVRAVWERTQQLEARLDAAGI